MTYPPGVTEESFLAAVSRIAGVLSKKAFGAHDEDDAAQLVALWSAQAVHRYDPAKGTLEKLLFAHCSNQLSNLRRNQTGCRTDPPCRTCYEHALGRGDGHEDGSVCPKFVAWWNRRQTKGRLAGPMPLDTVVVEGEHMMVADSTAESDAEMRELLNLIDARLPVEMRGDYLRMKAGEAGSVSIPRRRAVQRVVAEILADAGVEPVAFEAVVEKSLSSKGDAAEEVDPEPGEQEAGSAA